MSSSGSYKIRPAGRHILTIGKDLIQDSYAAVVELVKNAYDADSKDVEIVFEAKKERNGYSVTITDHGHGMSRDIVIGNWMVPSTSDKLCRKRSPSGRVMQGRKGVGRFAASILGTDLLLETVTPEGEKTTVLVEWDSFEAAEYLDDVEILIETVSSLEPAGTKLTMTGGAEILSEWNQKQFDKLKFELKKLTPEKTENDEINDDSFRISLNIHGFPNVEDVSEDIEPYPIFDLFDYRIKGKISADGFGSLVFSQQNARNSIEDKIDFNFGSSTDCGELFFDIRVYDREKESIESLIGRGLKDDTGNYVGKLQARQLLNEYNGIGVYRSGFRIRPLGDADFDWLKLNERRVQNPSLRLGSNQVIGHVQIQSDELSGLIEKSARDGLHENTAYESLKEITQVVISNLETRRFSYRKKTRLGKPSLKVERAIESLFSIDTLVKTVGLKLIEKDIDPKTVDEVIGLISVDAEEKNKIAEEIRQTVAIYQGQATLGKIINVILHEGRRPLSYFRNQVPRIRKKTQIFKNEQSVATANDLAAISENIGDNAEFFVDLFNRLDPLASRKRNKRKPLVLTESIQDSLLVFKKEMEINSVTAKVKGPDDFMFTGWQQDIVEIFTNLIDNSIYWMAEKKSITREINIEVVIDEGALIHIDFFDTGPGIEPDLITTDVIFEPQFTTKTQGTGLGLAIAGEAATRNGLELRVFNYNSGAHFRLQPITKESEND